MPNEDGGPAFPQSETQKGNSFRDEHGDGGMTLADYFAGQALAGILANNECMKEAMAKSATGNMSMSVREAVADIAYRYADAMIQARKPKGSDSDV